jgi:hypothetical protein
LADCTHHRLRAPLLALAAGLAAWALAAPAARADGDPASDVLAQQSVFIPAGRGIPAADQARLQAVVRAAARRGEPVRVALIADRSDLGAVTGLWRNPSGYATFLGTELSGIYHGTLIVVMPNGYGVSVLTPGATQADQLRAGASLVGAPLPGSGAATAADAVVAVRRVAAAAGHPLPAAAALAPTATVAPTGSGGPGAIAVIALVAGAALIAAAWAGSLRARPWRRGDGVASPTHGT